MSVQTVLAVDKNQFQKEQNDLLKTILHERFFSPWSLDYTYGDQYDQQKSLFFDSNLEIYITSTCNQSCEYCYLYNNPGIYPPEFNKKSIILNNLQVLLNWAIENHFHIPTLDLFSGEIWHSDYGLEVLEIIYQATFNGLWIDSITIPSNCSFVRDEEQLCKIQRYIDKFARRDIRLTFSISVEGAILENKMRPLNNNEQKTDAFYERLFLFAQHNNYFFHPMVASNSVKDWIENHKWWYEQCQEYNINPWEGVMMLEVRNDDWTDESIQDYCKFLDYLIELRKNELGNSNEEFFKDLLCINENCAGGYLPYSLAPADTFAGCSVSNSLTVRLGDLAICPCHRTAYNRYLYGHFVVKDNKIIDIEANNPQMAIKILASNVMLANFGCDTCPYAPLCLKGCYGSQLENMGDPFVQIPGICKFFKTKYKFLAQKYMDMGLREFINNMSPYHVKFLAAQQTLQMLEEVINNG